MKNCMNKVKILFTILLFMFLFGCDKKEDIDIGLNDEKELVEPISVLDSNLYTLYKQVKSLIISSDRRRADFIEEINENSWIYGIEDILVEIEKIDDINTQYVIKKNEEELHSFLISYQGNPKGVAISYVDITKDGNNDVVIVGEPPGGTLPTPYWTYLYDIKNDVKIDMFDNEGGLTEKQRNQLSLLLDEEFYELFPDYDIGNYTAGQPYVDERGNLYYWAGIFGEDFRGNVGDMIIFFLYDSENCIFNVVDYLYRPNYIYPE